MRKFKRNIEDIMTLPFEDLARECCEPLNVEVGELVNQGRVARVTLARQLYMTMLIEGKGFHLQDAAEAIGRRSHGTALFARKQILGRIYTPRRQSIIDALLNKYVQRPESIRMRIAALEAEAARLRTQLETLAETPPIQQD